MMDRYYNSDEYSRTHFDRHRTQKEMCLEYLKMYGSITPLEALTAFNCFRLAAVICELRRDGYDITTKLDDGAKKFAIYSLTNGKGEENNDEK